jgi:hypothetical protein
MFFTHRLVLGFKRESGDWHWRFDRAGLNLPSVCGSDQDGRQCCCYGDSHSNTRNRMIFDLMGGAPSDIRRHLGRVFTNRLGCLGGFLGCSRYGVSHVTRQRSCRGS